MPFVIVKNDDFKTDTTIDGSSRMTAMSMMHKEGPTFANALRYWAKPPM